MNNCSVVKGGGCGVELWGVIASEPKRNFVPVRRTAGKPDGIGVQTRLLSAELLGKRDDDALGSTNIGQAV